MSLRYIFRVSTEKIQVFGTFSLWGLRILYA